MNKTQKKRNIIDKKTTKILFLRWLTLDRLVRPDAKPLYHVTTNQVTGPVDPVGAVHAHEAPVRPVVSHEFVNGLKEPLDDLVVRYDVALAQDLVVADVVLEEEGGVVVAVRGGEVEQHAEVGEGLHHVFGAEAEVRGGFVADCLNMNIYHGKWLWTVGTWICTIELEYVPWNMNVS